MQQTHDTRIAALIGDLTALSTVLGAMHRDTDRVEPSWAAVCEEFEHTLRFDCLTNNLRDGWRLSSAAGFLAPTSSPPTDEERIAAAPFAALLTEAAHLFAVAGEFTDDDTDDDTAPAEAFAQFAELRETLALTVAALAELIAGLMLGRVTLPPLLDGDALAAAEAEGAELCAALEVECDAIRAAAGDA